MINLEKQKIKFELDKERSDISDQYYSILSKITSIEMEKIANTFKDFYKEHNILFDSVRNDIKSSPKSRVWEAQYQGKSIVELIINYRSEIESIDLRIYDEKSHQNKVYVHAEYIVQLPGIESPVVTSKNVISFEELKTHQSEIANDDFEAQRRKIDIEKLTNSLLETQGKYRYFYVKTTNKILIDDWKTFISGFYS